MRVPVVALAVLQQTAARQAGPVRTVQQSIRGMAVSFLARVPYIAIGIVVLVVFWVAGRVVRRLVRLAARRAGMEPELTELFGSGSSVLVSLLGLLVAAVVVFPGFTPGNLVAGIGITSVAVGFAFRDILQNFFAGVLILWRRPFRIGDEIESGTYSGKVEEITTRSTRILTYDGERAIIPNSDVYTNAVLVRTAYPNRRVKLAVGIGYPDSIEEARKVIHGVLAKTEGVEPDPGPWVYVSELGGSSVNFTVYFWTASPQRNVLAVADRAITGIKLALDEAGIDMPYPHTVVLFDGGAVKLDTGKDAPPQAESA